MLLGSLVERHVAPFSFSNGFVLIDKRLVRRNQKSANWFKPKIKRIGNCIFSNLHSKRLSLQKSLFYILFVVFIVLFTRS